MTMLDTITLGSIAAFYVALAVALYFLLMRKYIQMQKVLTVAMVVVNLRYAVFGMRASIAWVTNASDVLTDLLVGMDAECPQHSPAICTQVPGNPNSLLPQYTAHPSWAADLYHLFGDGPTVDKICMHIHVLAMTIALSVSFIHIFFVRGKLQRLAGRVSAMAAAIGVPMGLVVGLTNGNSEAYGGMWSVYGWIWMSGSSFFLLSKGVLAVMQSDIKSHKRWMTRFYVAMWCDFLVFRLLLFIVTPFITQCKSCAFLPMIYLSPVIGLVVGEIVLRGKDHSKDRIFFRHVVFFVQFCI